MNPTVILFFFTLLPLLELRFSIPYGILAQSLPVWWVVVVAITANALLIPVVYVIYKYALEFFLRWKVIDRCYQKFVVKTQHKVHPYIERYGLWGLALFVGIPLPGSGVYSGVLGAHLLGMKFHEIFVGATLGVIIAGLIVTGVVISGNEVFSLFISSHI